MTKPLETANYLKKRLKYLIGYDQLNPQEKMTALKNQENTTNYSAHTIIMAKQTIIRLKINRWRKTWIKCYHQLCDRLSRFFQPF